MIAVVTLAIDAVGLGKRYSLGGSSVHANLRETISGLVRRGRRSDRADVAAREIWALEDVSFEVPVGQALGIVGRNGAGKSTLLKILSRITEPTCGCALVRGRVGSLLEVGTGFHPELSGRENVYLNGAVLGLTRRDIAARFDEIVAFAGTERFLDTPVKYYSSGMYMRLAFAVAAHLEPDVLVVDEVLAVGDAEFQKKCLGTMKDAARSGRTVLFVSHNLAVVQNLCDRALLLEAGRIVLDGSPREAIDRYLAPTTTNASTADLTTAPGRRSGAASVLKLLTLRDGSGRQSNRISCGSQLAIELEFAHERELSQPNFGVLVTTREGMRVFHAPSTIVGGLPPTVPSVGTAICTISHMPLAPGRYVVSVGCEAGSQLLDQVDDAMEFEVVSEDMYGTGRLPDPRNGPLVVPARWSITGMDGEESETL